MKKITLTADEALLKRAQAKARADQTTLTKEFQRWLEDYVATEDTSDLSGQSTPDPATPKAKAAGQKITLARCVDALKKFEKKLEEKL